MYYRTVLLTALGVALAPLAFSAQPVTGPYVAVGVGIDYLQPQNLHGISQSILGSQLATNVGGIASGAVGYGFGNGLRLEIQGDFTSEKFYQNATNYFQQYHGFVNALYDIDGGMIGLPFLSPYLGAGGGYGVSHLVNDQIPGMDAAGNSTLLHSTGTYGDFAVQGIVGLAFNVGVPGLALTAEYRFVTQPTDASYNAQFFDGDTVGRVKIKTDGEYNHVALFGLRYALFSPAPPPPALPAPPPAAAPAPAPSRTYLVFFDWDRADLTTRARQIVAEAAQASTHVQTTRIEVNGYTDLSGTAAYNQRLSVRRAQSVEAELVRDGVPSGEISIHGYGESNPLVPTAKGVREPQNRRVEIILK
jgi:outer membrane protein OmpA-like peptidoglycan-associated protein